MIEVAGCKFEATVGSDLDRDGMYLEITDESRKLIAEVFFSDKTGRMALTLFRSGIPIEVVEWLIERAKIRLPRSADADS